MAPFVVSTGKLTWARVTGPSNAVVWFSQDFNPNWTVCLHDLGDTKSGDHVNFFPSLDVSRDLIKWYSRGIVSAGEESCRGRSEEC